MKQLFVLSCVCIVFRNVYSNSDPNNKVQKRFTVVTHFPDFPIVFRTFQERTKQKSVHENAPTVKLICQDITSSEYFQLNEEISVDMDTAYSDLKANKKETKDNSADTVRMFRGALKGYVRQSGFTMKFETPSYWDIKTKDNEKIDDVFVCLTKHFRTKRLNIYFVSEEFNLLAREDPSKYFAGRIVIRENPRSLFALAEEPALALPIPDHDVEDLYLKMRSFYKSTEEDLEDPLCRMSSSKKMRTCALVMNSSYFENKVEYLPDEDHFEDECEKWKVSTTPKTDGETGTGVNSPVLDEWMLPCPVKPIEPGFHSVYFVSRAYNSHYVFVHWCNHLTKKCHLKNISKNISVMIDKCVEPHCITV